MFGALLDYTDYDHTSPSLRLVDPFTERPYEVHELPPQLLRRTVRLGEGTGRDALFEVSPLIRIREGLPPLVRIPGTRDYYGLPTGNRDAWLLHRHLDVGSLGSLAAQLHAYGLGAPDPNREASDERRSGSASVSTDAVPGTPSRPGQGPDPL